MQIISTVLASCFCLLNVASAQSSNQEPEQIAQRQLNCNNATSNIEIKECIRLRYEAADRRLNQVYQQLMSRVSNEERSLLVDAQLGWIQLRDKNCEFEAHRSLGRTGYRGFLDECKERLTRQRTAELETYLRQR